MDIRSRLCTAFATVIFFAAAANVRAEVSEVTIAQQYGVSFLPLMWMEHNKLIEKHARAQGLPELKTNWAKLAGPAAITDGLLAGGVTFSAVGAPTLITLWGKTKGNIGVMGVSAVTTYPLYLNVRNPNVKSIRDFTDKDKIAVPAVKVSTQAIMLQMAAEKVFGEGNQYKLDPFTVTLSHPDGMAALMSNTGGVNAHFTTSPFHEQELKIPGVRTLTTSYEILGGRATALVIVATTKFREANPKTYNAFVAALKEAIDGINRDKKAAAQRYLEWANDKKSTVDDVYAAISNPDYAFTLVPEKVFKTAEFMGKIGSIKDKPASWKDLFFPEAHNLPGN
ncbi:MAG: ABC transporter substrate-binding protein [Burkholderiales bacterium]